MIDAYLVEQDPVNDIAVLSVKYPQQLPPGVTISRSGATLGENVYTIGFPHPTIMGSAPKFTSGTVSSLRGLMDDPRAFQISVPVQSGNSGGPLLNQSGEVIGILVSKLSPTEILRLTGDLPQNVNYAVKAPYVTTLLAALPDARRNSGRSKVSSGPDHISNSVVQVIAR